MSFGVRCANRPLARIAWASCSVENVRAGAIEFRNSSRVIVAECTWRPIGDCAP